MEMDKKIKHTARINLHFTSSSSADAFLKSIDAEISGRGSVKFSRAGAVCEVFVSASDLVALRALINSVLRIASIIERLDEKRDTSLHQ